MTSSEPHFESWYRALRPRLVAAVAAAFGDRDLANEAADEAVTRAFERWSTVSLMESPDAWAYTCAFNVARRRLRRRGLEQRLLSLWRPEPVPAPSGELWAVVARLPERQRLAVALRHVGHLREAEVAEIMGITRGAVSATLRSAYTSLRHQLRDPEFEPEALQ